MTLQLAFWILMLLWLVFGGLQFFQGPSDQRWGLVGPQVLPFILFALLGWQVFGAPIKG